MTSLKNLVIAIKGAGEMATGVAWRLHAARFKIVFTEIEKPMAVRRAVSFCEAVYDGVKTVEGVTTRRVESADEVPAVWEAGDIPLLIDPDMEQARQLKPDVLLEATLAKRNLGTSMNDAPLVIALGPGHTAGRDAHFVIETNRGHNLGRLITEGEAAANTGVPGNIGGFTSERVFRSPAEGVFEPKVRLGDLVEKGQTVAVVAGVEVSAGVSGIVRGLIRPGVRATKGLKIGDVDPRGNREYLETISEKARAIGGSVLEAILRVYNI